MRLRGEAKWRGKGRKSVIHEITGGSKVERKGQKERDEEGERERREKREKEERGKRNPGISNRELPP